MASFTAQDVKKLREMTNCGMMDCKKALTETDGDMDKAIEFLREKGLATAAKKAGRIAAEGIVKAYMNGNVGVLVEVNSETDFVAKNQEFQDFVSLYQIQEPFELGLVSGQLYDQAFLSHIHDSSTEDIGDGDDSGGSEDDPVEYS